MMIYYVVVFSDCLWFMSGLWVRLAALFLIRIELFLWPVPAVVVHFSGWEWSMGFK